MWLSDHIGGLPLGYSGQPPEQPVMFRSQGMDFIVVSCLHPCCYGTTIVIGRTIGMLAYLY